MDIVQPQSQTSGQIYNQASTQQFAFNLAFNDIFGQTHHEVTFDDEDNQNEKVKIVELWLKEETFSPSFSCKISPEIESILRQTSECAGEMTEAISIAVETYKKVGTANGIVSFSRFVLVNELGQRVFDAQIKVTNALQAPGKAQLKFLREQAYKLAPESKLVKKHVLKLLKGHRVVGYNLGAKHQDIIEMARSYSTPDDTVPNPFDCSDKFSKVKGVQDSLQSLCSQYLKIMYRRSFNQPSAFTEAKISMALYKTWKMMQGLDTDPKTSTLQLSPITEPEKTFKIVEPSNSNKSPKAKVQVLTQKQLKEMIEKMVANEVEVRMKKLLEKLDISAE